MEKTIAISCKYASKVWVDLWDVATWQHKTTLIGNNAAYSPGGNTITTKSDKEVYLWDAAIGKQIATFTGHVGDIYSFSYSPDGKTIATGISDGTVLLWEIASTEIENPVLNSKFNPKLLQETPSSFPQHPDINPREIRGNWRAGWALDVHTLSSRPLPGGGV